ncbi:MAG: polyprenyl synthetase family protein [Candidatus Micrarchaeota archaeon]|nr:polyprenyl synthetase family protein [Candidatus Micrarchaeota archaeon]
MAEADMMGLENKLVRLNAPVHNRLKGIFSKKQEPAAVYGLLSEFLLVEGKGIRPALCLLSCEAVGGRREDALKAAVAIEMFHNFTLIHDDIEDGSELRRGKPCMHIKYGVPLALNAGDGLFMMVWRETLSIRSLKREEAQRRLLFAFTEVLEGQALELGWHKDGVWDVSEKEYLKMVGGKTGALIAVSCGVGALLGGADKKTCEAMARFGAGIGMSFQIIDDVLNVIGDEKKYRKEIGGDISEGKRTLITMWALRMLPCAKRARLGMLLKRKSRSRADVNEALALLRESGAPEKAMGCAKKMVDAALSELECLPDSRARRLLAGVAAYITTRER